MRVVIGSMIGLLALWLAFRGESPAGLWHAISLADPIWTMLALVSVVASVAAVIVRWQVLFTTSTLSSAPAPASPRPAGAGSASRDAREPAPDAIGQRRPRLASLARAVVLGQTVNIVMPIRIGEILRIAMICRSDGQTVGRVFMTLIVERLLDTAMIAVAAIALVMQVALPVQLEGPVRALTFAGLVAACATAVLVVLGDRVRAWLNSRIERLTHQGMARFAKHGAAALGEAAHLRDPRALVPALAWSFLILALSVTTNYLLFRAFNLSVPFAAALLVLLSLQIISAPISTPGNLGVFQYVTVLVLGVYRIDHSVAVAYSVVLYLIAYGPKLVVGAWLFLQALGDRSLGPEVRSIVWKRR